MSSLNKGLSEYTNVSGPVGSNSPINLEAFTCHVLEVVKDEKSPFYDKALGLTSIGSLKVKIVDRQYNDFEDSNYYRAFPYDRGDYTIPLPGEAVMCVIGMIPMADGPNRTFGMGILYVSTISLDNQLSKNVAPFLSADAYHVDSRMSGFFRQLQIDADIVKQRFDNRYDIPEKAFKDNANTTLMRFGDTILEGRFGGLIKMTSTQTEGWDAINQITNIGTTSMPSDPMTIIKAHRRYREKSTTISNVLDSLFSEKPRYLDDDINFDDASIYMLSTQNVPLEIRCSEHLKTWDYTTHIDGLSTTKSNITSLTSLFKGGFDPNYKLSVKLIGTLEIPGFTGGGGGGDNVGGGANTPLSADVKAKTATLIKAFMDSGYTLQQAAGLAGNIYAESGGMKEWNIENSNPNQQPGPDGSYGKAPGVSNSGISLMQWTWGNRDKWEKYVGQYLQNTPGADTSRIKNGRLITNPATFDGKGETVEEYLKNLRGLFDASVSYAVNDYVPNLGNFIKMMKDGVPRGNTASIVKYGGFVNLLPSGKLDTNSTATVCEMFLCDGEVPATVGQARLGKGIEAYQKSVRERVAFAIQVFNEFNTAPV